MIMFHTIPYHVSPSTIGLFLTSYFDGRLRGVCAAPLSHPANNIPYPPYTEIPSTIVCVCFFQSNFDGRLRGAWAAPLSHPR